MRYITMHTYSRQIEPKRNITTYRMRETTVGAFTLCTTSCEVVHMRQHSFWDIWDIAGFLLFFSLCECERAYVVYVRVLECVTVC